MLETQPTPARLRPLETWHTVLIVDDEPRTLAALRRELDQEPYDVVTTDRPQLALEWMALKDVSLVISDQRMPEMNGDLLLEGVWKKSPTTARLLLTGHPETLPAIPASRLSLLKVLTKPWDPWQLKAVIRELLGEREGSGAGPRTA